MRATTTTTTSTDAVVTRLLAALGPELSVRWGDAGDVEVLHGPLRDLLAAPNMTFAALREQPARLRAEAARLDECVRNVCVADDGRALLGVEECERRVGDFLERVGESVDVMVGESVDEVVGASRDQVVGDSANALLDNVTASLLTFRKLVSGDDGTTTRRDLEDVKLVLNHYTPVANLLSVPALMRELALAHHHDEALDLDAFIHRLATLHPKHAVLADLHAHVRVVRQEMRGALVDALRGDVGLQAALRMVAVLRRMGGANTSTSASASDEVALRGAFLRARAVYLWQVVGRAGTVDATNTIATGTDGSPSVPSSPLTATPLVAMDPASAEAFTFVKRFVETFRATFIDIITQYQAIFVTSPTPTAYRQHQQQPLASSITGKYRPSLSPPSDTTATAILSSFVWHTLRRFHATLALHIERITDTAQLATLLTQTMHLGVALGRKGVEMRFAVRTMFEQRCRRVVEEMIASGVDDFRDEIKACGMSSMMATTAKAQVVAATASTVTSAFQAPVVLLDYPPLAALTNVYLSAFTALRALPIATLRHPLVDAIHNSFDELAATLRTYSLSPRISASVATGSGAAMSERAVFTGLVRVMHDVWAPYVIRCLSDGVYGSLSRATDGVNTTTPSLRGFSELIVLAGV